MKGFGSRLPTSSRRRSGRLFVLSAPSGSGKTTILGALLKAEKGVVRSVSVTTRKPRVGEKEGRDYRFRSVSQFMRARSKGEFLECARILDHWYGTPKTAVQKALKAGRDVLLGVDIEGARQIRESGLPVTTIFLLPPSLETLKERLKKRGTETTAEIRARLARAKRELAQAQHYNYAVVNDRLPEAILAVRAIVRAQRCQVRQEAR